jgi:hypothetical protein
VCANAHAPNAYRRIHAPAPDIHARHRTERHRTAPRRPSPTQPSPLPDPQVHPKVAELGLHRFLTIAGVHKLPLSNTAMSSFHLAWNAGLAQYQSVQREIALPQAVALLTAFLSLSEPLHLLLAGFRFDAATVHWAHVVRLVGLVWFGLSVTFLLITIGCAVYSTESMRRLRHASMQLVADYPVHRLFVSHVVDSQPLACSVAYVLPGTKTVVVVALLVLLASGVPWLFIPFWGWRPIDSVLQALPTVAQHSLHRGAGVRRRDCCRRWRADAARPGDGLVGGADAVVSCTAARAGMPRHAPLVVGGARPGRLADANGVKALEV